MGHLTNKNRADLLGDSNVIRGLSLAVPAPNQVRQHLLRRIGLFEEIDGEFVGHIATLNFKCKAILKENPYRTTNAEPEYVLVHEGAEVFHPDLGYAWGKNTDGNSIPYKEVHIDDPAFPKTIVAMLVRGGRTKEGRDFYNLFWDRVTITDDDIERQHVTEELIPYIGVLRPIDKVTEYLLKIYPSLREAWDVDDYDYD